jgi:hypothetical protein
MKVFVISWKNYELTDVLTVITDPVMAETLKRTTELIIDEIEVDGEEIPLPPDGKRMFYIRIRRSTGEYLGSGCADNYVESTLTLQEERIESSSFDHYDTVYLFAKDETEAKALAIERWKVSNVRNI